MAITAPGITLSDCEWTLIEFDQSRGEVREQMRRELHTQRQQVAGVAFRLREELEEKWDWLDTHRDHSHYQAGEDEVLTLLAEYETWHRMAERMRV